MIYLSLFIPYPFHHCPFSYQHVKPSEIYLYLSKSCCLFCSWWDLDEGGWAGFPAPSEWSFWLIGYSILCCFMLLFIHFYIKLSVFSKRHSFVAMQILVTQESLVAHSYSSVVRCMLILVLSGQQLSFVFCVLPGLVHGALTRAWRLLHIWRLKNLSAADPSSSFCIWVMILNTICFIFSWLNNFFPFSIPLSNS